MASFCYYSRLSSAQPLASSDTTAYYRPAPGRTDSIPERDQRPRDNGYKSVFTNSWLVCQRNRSWIKESGKNQQEEWTRSLFAVPSVQGHRTVTPMDSEKQLRVYTSGRTMTRHMWRVDKAPGHPRRNRNVCLKVLRLSWVTFLRVHTASDANWLKNVNIYCYETFTGKFWYISLKLND